MQLSCLPLDLKWMPRGTSGIGHILRWHFFGEIKGLFCLILEGNRYLSFILRKKFWQHSFLLLLGDFSCFTCWKLFNSLYVIAPIDTVSVVGTQKTHSFKAFDWSVEKGGLKTWEGSMRRASCEDLKRIWIFFKCERYNHGRWDGKLPNCGIVSYQSWEDMP